jgi:hypothetical protein
MPNLRMLKRASIRRTDGFINFEDFASNATKIMQAFQACHSAIWRLLFFPLRHERFTKRSVQTKFIK